MKFSQLFPKFFQDKFPKIRKDFTVKKDTRYNRKCTLISETCVSDAIKLYNLAPESIKNSAALHSLKKKTKECVKTLPI